MPHVPVDELGAGIRMHLNQRKGQCIFDTRQSLPRCFVPFVPLCTGIRPVRTRINSTQREDEITQKCIATVRHGVDLRVSRWQVLPWSFEYGDDRLESRWFRRGETSAYTTRLLKMSNPPSYGMLTHRKELRGRFIGVSPHLVSPQYLDVLSDLRMQQLTACFVTGFPDIVQGSSDVGSVYSGTAALIPAQRIVHLQLLELSTHRVAVHPRHKTDVIRDRSSLFPVSFRIKPRSQMPLKNTLLGRHIHMAPR